MDALIFALNAVLPIVLTVALGYFLKRVGLIPQSMSPALNKLVFRVFLPIMLFLNVYKIEHFSISELSCIGYVVAAVALTFFVMLPIVCAFTKDGKKRGVLLQGSFRTNYALIGIPLAESIAGEAGVLTATILSAIVVPFYNVLAVISLSIFGDGQNKPSAKKIIIGILKNPLIDSIALGFVFLGARILCPKVGFDFSPESIKPLWSVIQNMGALATPLALLSLGAQFEFSAVKELRRELSFALVTRIVVLPILGIGAAYLLFSNTFSAGQFAALIAVFATPVAVSSVPMTQEMGGDSALAGQIVVFTTLFSVLSVFCSCFLLRLAGIFG
jgi:predicted permease